MFKSARWRSEKNKIKIVFKLQFHATQVPKAEGLKITIVPGDVGKSTGETEKALVLDGHCRWESPVYETVKFHQDVKTGKVNKRIYHLTVSTTGSTKSNLVGETSIDFADYADAVNTCNVSLPLQNSNSKAMLHVSIQRQLENVDQHSVVKERDNLVKGSDLKSQLSIETDENHKGDSQEEGSFGKYNRIAELRRRASIESDTTLSSFDSVSEIDTFGEVGSRRDHIQQNHPNMHHYSATNIYEEPHISEFEWSGSSDQGISTDDSTNGSNDTIPRVTSKTSMDDEVAKLKAELTALARRADLSELELQSLRKQTVKETKRSQELLREVTSLKQERDTLKADYESIKASDKRKEEAKIRNKLQFEGSDPQILLEETREELDYEKDLNSNLRLQLQKTQESNTELILAVQDLEAMLGQRSKKAVDFPRPRTCENNNKEQISKFCTSETDDDEDQKALDELVKGHMDAKEAHVLEQRITDLYNDIEIYKRDKEDLEIQMEQLALDYEILKQENHDISYKLEQSQVQEQLRMQYECSSSIVNVSELENQVECLEVKLKKQSEDFSESLCRIKELETQIEGMEEELEKQAQIFEADIEAVTRDKVEQEQRAIEAEEALRMTRWKNASVAGKIQDEFKRISEQMSFTFAANEKMTVKAMSEARELRMQKCQLEEFLMKANDELRANRVKYEDKLDELSAKTELKTKEMERVIEDLVEKSNHLENHTRHAEDVNADLIQEITRLKDENEVLRLQMEETRKSSVEAEASLQKRNTEKDELVSMIASMKKESESLTEELQSIKDENEEVIARFDDLKHSLSENESEIEKHKKQVVQARSELKKKEEEMANLENIEAAANNVTKAEKRSTEERLNLLEEQIKVKDNALEASSNMFIKKERDLKNQIEDLQTKLDKLSPNSLETEDSLHGSEAMQNREVLSINKSDDLQVLVNEVASLKEQNEFMEMELKEMQERYSEISLRFAEVEGERQKLVMNVRYLKNAKKSSK